MDSSKQNGKLTSLLKKKNNKQVKDFKRTYDTR